MTFSHTLYNWWDRYDTLFVRAAIILGVIGASLVLGRRVSMLYFLPFAGIGAVLIFMRIPALGVILTVIGGMSIPFYGPSGLNVAMMGAALLLGLWLAKMIVIDKKIQLVSLGTAGPGLALVAVSTMALLVGQLPWYPTQQAPLGAQLGALAIFVLSVGIFLVMSNQVRSLVWLKAITFSFLAFTSLDTLGWVSPVLGRYLDPLFAYGATGSLFWNWMICLAFGQALYNRDLHIGWRILLMVQVALGLYATYGGMYDWKSGWVPPFAGITVMVALRSWRMLVAMAVGSIVPAMYLISRAIESDEYSYSTRVEAWEIVLEITRLNPILGLGPANYYWYTPLFPIRGYYVHFNSHSQLVDMVAQVGILGLLVFAWFILRLGWLGVRMLLANYRDGFARAYVFSALGGLVGTLVAAALGDWVLPFFYNVGLAGFRASMLGWLFLGGLVALDHIMRTRQNETDTRYVHALPSEHA